MARHRKRPSDVSRLAKRMRRLEDRHRRDLTTLRNELLSTFVHIVGEVTETDPSPLMPPRRKS